MSPSRRLELPLSPDPEEADLSQIFVDAKVDGEACRLLFDTGARRTTVPWSPRLAALSQTRDDGGRGVSGAVSEATVVTVDELSVGPYTERGLAVELLPRESAAPAVLGMDVIGGACGEFAFDAERLVIDAPAPTSAPLWPLDSEPRRQPTVPLAIADTVTDAVWDTGASITVVDQGWAAAHPGAITPDGSVSTGTDSAGRSVSSTGGRLSACEIGGLEFAATRCAVVDLSPVNEHLANPLTVILGLPVLLQATWWMDFPGRRWAVVRPAPGPARSR
ncbi:aspartyl protease family protein [Microlunatus sp. Y2014]|uniref:aspartyl protease family protein n=1 Tax=Microlunatus sp. Y2014 TaxID=3418488 RepID=UPI003DA790FA